MAFFSVITLKSPARIDRMDSVQFYPVKVTFLPTPAQRGLTPTTVTAAGDAECLFTPSECT